MANNQYVNKVVFGNEVLIDLSNDTIDPTALIPGLTAHDKSGASITGTMPIKTGLDIVKEFIDRTYQSDDHVLGLSFSNGYYTAGTLKLSQIQIPVPSSGTNTIEIQVPNGTATPDPSNSEDWITVTFTVDSSGNTEIFTPTNEST